MPGPPPKELTERELAVMRVYWDDGRATAEDARQRLSQCGVELAYVTVANVVRSLADKGFLKQLNTGRPFLYEAARSFEDVSKRLVGDLVKRLFDGSRQQLLVQVLGKRRLTKAEREFLTQILNEQEE